MIADDAYRMAMRARLKTLSVCTTGVTTLVATTTGYTRAAGSFLTDGFRAGMEVTPEAGFSDTTRRTITAVSASEIRVGGTAVTAQESASGRELLVELPSVQVWEGNEPVRNGVTVNPPPAGEPYITEEYLPGAGNQFTFGRSTPLVQAEPLYVVGIKGPIGVGADALAGYTDALRRHFAPGLTLAIPDSTDVLRVRGDLMPYPSQQLREGTRWAVTFTVPFRAESRNSL